MGDDSSGHWYPPRRRGLETPMYPSSTPPPFAPKGTARGWIPRERYPAPVTGTFTPGVPIIGILWCEGWAPETGHPRKLQDGRAKRSPVTRGGGGNRGLGQEHANLDHALARTQRKRICSMRPPRNHPLWGEAARIMGPPG